MEELLSNDRIIAYHRQKDDYEESPPNTLQYAYGDFRYQKMTKELFLADDILKLKTLEEINEDLQNDSFHRGDFISLALLSSDILAVLISHLSNNQNKIRELSSNAIQLVCSVQIGRDEIIKQNYVVNILKLFDDHVEQIRHNAYQSLLNISEYQQGVNLLVKQFQSVLQPLVDKLIEENVESILIEVLLLMTRTLSGEQGQVEILRTPAIKRLTGLLERSNSEIRKLACQNLGAISFSEKGKIEVINQGCVLELVICLKDKDQKVVEQASMAVASLAQRNEAKFIIIKENRLPVILSLLDTENEQIKLNVVQMIASMAEHPKGRKECYFCLEVLKEIVKDPKCIYIAPYATEAIDIILWQP